MRDDERAERVDRERGARRHDRRRGRLLDDRRALDDRARREVVARDDRASCSLAADEDRLAARRGGSCVADRRAARAGLGAAEVAERRRADDDELDRRARVGVAEARVVRLVEALGERRRRSPSLERLAGAVSGIVERVLLARRSACRAHARTRPVSRRDALRRRAPRRPPPRAARERRGELVRGRASPSGVKKARAEVVADLASPASPTRRTRRGSAGTMTSPISSSRARKAACIGPAPPKATSAKSRGSMPCSTVSVRIACAIFALMTSQMPSASSLRRRGRARRRGSATAVARGVDVERHLAAGEVRRVDAAEHEVRVGHGRLRAAAAVAGGAGVGPGALRPDAQAAGLGVGERAAAGADRVDVDDRHQQREALERRLGGDVGLAVDDEADVEAGAAHVDADQVRTVEHARQRDAAHRAADRAPRAGSAASRSRADSAVTMPPLDCITCSGTASPLALQLGLEPLEVAAHDRRRVGVDDRRRGALVLAPLARDAVRERDRDVVELLEQDLLGAQLVRRVRRRRRGSATATAPKPSSRTRRGGRADGVLVERLELLAARSRAGRAISTMSLRGTSGVGLR